MLDDLVDLSASTPKVYPVEASHFDGLFQYGLESFRLCSSKGVFDAFRSLMRQDVKVSIPAESLAGQTHYKRHFETSQGFSGKNVELFLGN